jgi:hypothetical protein
MDNHLLCPVFTVHNHPITTIVHYASSQPCFHHCHHLAKPAPLPILAKINRKPAANTKPKILITVHHHPSNLSQIHGKISPPSPKLTRAQPPQDPSIISPCVAASHASS